MNTGKSLRQILNGTPYEAYLYSYPHKTSYRRLDPPVPLDEAWAGENCDALFLYLHIPFCEMRCGFCNLFTTAKPKQDFVDSYLGALERQARRVRSTLGKVSFARFAIGGGTPTLLDTPALESVLDLAEGTMGADLARIPVSVEISPETASFDKLRLLRSRGVDRVSIGVQSFIESEVAAVFRPQQTSQVEQVLGMLKELSFPTLNIDLMYGLPGQTPATWRRSLDAALRFSPAELYLYPLYVRPLTSLGKSSRSWDDERLALYRAGRELLLDRGFTQVSMRMFRSPHAPSTDGPVYHCQEDGMVGLGSGARSYTDRLHYSSEYAVGSTGVKEIIHDFIARDDASFAFADYGFHLDDEDRRRRWVILSLLAEGIDLEAYRQRFGTDALSDFPSIAEIEIAGLATRRGNAIVLTPEGVERSDAIGPWLFSARVNGLMESFELR